MTLTRDIFWEPDPYELRPTFVLSLTATDKVQIQAETPRALNESQILTQ